jgi:hypothetical protein
MGEIGETNFSREILHLCQSKNAVNYLELKEQVIRQVLETDEYYNDWIYVKIRKTKSLMS